NRGMEVSKIKSNGQDSWTYGYDQRGRLTSVKQMSLGTTLMLLTYTYDVEDHLVQEQKWKLGGSTLTTRHAPDGEATWDDLDGTNSVLVRYLVGDGIDQPLARTLASGAVSVYLVDRLGSVRDLTDSGGVIRDHLDYDGFGNVTE